METFKRAADVTRAEILWSLKCATLHYLFNSSEGMADLFKVMFLDSQIAQHFTCGKDKCRYLTTFGIGPHFQDLLRSRTNKSNGIVLLFDESLNSELEKKQMDIHARFWDGDEESVVTRYLISCFLGHGTAEDLRKAITSGLQTAQLNCCQLIQLSMDGPAVNHKLHRLLATDLQSVVSPSFQLIDIGTCSLHVLHNSFKAGHEATSWDIGSFLSSLHYLFHDSPARKEDFIVLTGSMMRLEYCSHRWLENIPVAKRALKVWPHVKMFIKDILAKKKPPAIKSFTFLVNCINDKLLEAKLEAFISVARIIHPCLQRYQTQTPMLPFMAEDLALCQRSLLQRFVKQNKVQDCSMTSLVELDLQDPSNLLDVGKVDPGFKAKQIVQSLENVSPKELLAFKIDCRNFARAAAEKLRKKISFRFKTGEKHPVAKPTDSQRQSIQSQEAVGNYAYHTG